MVVFLDELDASDVGFPKPLDTTREPPNYACYVYVDRRATSAQLCILRVLCNPLKIKIADRVMRRQCDAYLWSDFTCNTPGTANIVGICRVYLILIVEHGSLNTGNETRQLNFPWCS